MFIAYWIVAGLLALVFLVTGGNKLVKSKEALIASGMHWATGVPAWQIRALAALEVAGAIGLILPIATGIAPLLSPIAAIGLAIILVGASVVHGRLGERRMIGVNLVLTALAIAAAVLGFILVLG